MRRAPGPTRVERLLDEEVVTLVPVTPHGALPDTIGAVVARSLGLQRRPAPRHLRWHDATGAFTALAPPEPPVDLGNRRQVLLALTASHRLAVIGADRLGRPLEVLWSCPVAAIERVAVEAARLAGIATDALVVDGPDGSWRFLLTRPHRRSARALAATLGSAVRYSEG